MVEKRRALGRGLGALIPGAPAGRGDRPVDVFFNEREAPHAAEPPEDHITPPTTSGDSSAPLVRAHRLSADAAHQEGQTDLSDADRGGGRTETDSATPDGVGSADGAGAVTATDRREEPNGSALSPVPGAQYAELDILTIRPNPRQPRTAFDEDSLAELVSSIKEVGILQPIVVRPIPTGELADADGKRYELIMGERRWRASLEADQARIPAIIKETHDDDLLRDALLENLHRSQLNPLEEAAAYRQLLDDFGCSHEELATRIGRSRPQISNMLRLLKLPPPVQRRVAAGVLGAGHARAVLGLADSAAMERMAHRIVAEGLSVRTVEELVALGEDDDVSRPRRPRAGTRNPQLDELAAGLADHLDTRVNVALGQRKGKVTVDFASVEDLKRILALMGVAPAS
ncbi:MAG: ParB/RepB/Spo0J family partition protein [Micrococcales bacterium]|nr:ParB/RepB/Spo0J family partition protein [Micrococcales bacterium]